VVSNEFGQIVENNGGRGMNATTGCDATNYFYMFPANRLELWAYLEGNRMGDPVLREFYTEKDGPVTEERRMRTDNNPIGRLIEKFQNTAFSAHPYHHSTIGYMSDIQNISRQDCLDFYQRNYVGSNMTVAVVGDVQFAEVQRLAEKYFTKIPAGDPYEPTTVEPEQVCEKRIVMKDPAQPFLFMGYHKGSINHPDDAVYNAIADILGQGRTSRLYKVLVKEKKIAVQVGTWSGYPGQKYPNLMMFYAVPAKGVTAAECEEVILSEVDKLVAEMVSTEELDGVKQRAKANLIRSLRGNQGLARQLCYYQSMTGDWREAFRRAEKIERVTPEDIHRVAEEIFVPSNRTVASIVTEDEGS
jgi:predicted Zn-dependent peptidase